MSLPFFQSSKAYRPPFLQEETKYNQLFEESQSKIEELEVRQSCLVDSVVDLYVFIGHFSSLKRLLKAVCWLRKFVQHLSGQAVSQVISVSDIESAKTSLVKFVQSSVFSRELTLLSQQQRVPNSSPIRQMCPVLIDGIVCVGGRLENSSEASTKHPILLPHHHLTTLVVRDIHEGAAHIGTNHTLSVLRRKYYIVKGYSFVKSVLKDCVVCKRHHGQPCNQKMADLPKERTATTDPPFTFVGVDYFGPMNVKFRRGSTKRYGCIFTCLVTRAVHIEVAHSMDSDAFLMALHRFMARRGKPQKVFSDNGTNFVAANIFLRTHSTDPAECQWRWKNHSS